MATINIHSGRDGEAVKAFVNEFNEPTHFVVLKIECGVEEVSYFLRDMQQVKDLYLMLGNAMQAAAEMDTAGPSADPIDDDDVFEINGPPADDDEPTAGQYNTTSGQWNKRAQG